MNTQTFTITFLPSGKTVTAADGITLLEAQIQAGLHPDAPCGGRGTCGKCLVQIQSGQITGIQKACETKVHSDMVVDTSFSASGHKLLTAGASREIPVAPKLTAVPIHLPKIRLGENISDWQRLKNAIWETNPEEASALEPDLSLISSLFSFYKEGNDGFAVLGHNKILALTHEAPSCYLAAFDIGTTSIVGYLLDSETGKELAASSLLNPQAQYGADVIMRSNYALEHSPAPLRDAVRQAVVTILDSLCEKANIYREEIFQISFVANTCMSHLFLGISPDSLVHAPYHPACSDALVLDADSLGIPIHPRGQIFILPNIAGFVGADTVGCMVSADFDHRERLTLLIDIGTNGEMVLGNKQERVCCSTAAGPAFEGAKITCGMRGADGAIDHFAFKEKELSYSVIGNGVPTGICGSGLMDLVAALLSQGFIDESGRLLHPDELQNPTAIEHAWRLKEIHGDYSFLISDTPEALVYLTQKDIREIQLAKAAIAAGITLLTEHLHTSVSKIEEVLIAGAFGSFMKPESACRIGLIPMELLSKITSIGNAAGEGAKAAVLNHSEWEHAKELAAHTSFLELATSPAFQDCFIDELDFTE